MATQLYSFKITYTGCEDKIWRIAAVSSNYTLAKLGYLVLASFETMAYHLFEMKYENTTYFLKEEEYEDMPCRANETFDLLGGAKIGKLGLRKGDVIEMTYDMGCCQEFEITLLEICDMPKGSGRVYPIIFDGAGRGIVDDMPSDELAEAIEKIDRDGHSEIYYSNTGSIDAPEWDYRDYSIEFDNTLLKGTIELIRDGYEQYMDEYDEY